MLNYVFGDLLESDEAIIAHGANSMGVMGSGVAKAIRDKYPECYQVYRDVYEESGLDLSEVVYCTTLSPQMKPLIIANCITQKDFGRDPNTVYCSYEAIEESLDDVLYLASTLRFESIGIPMIGAGLAHGDWNIISQIIENLSEYHDVDVNCYIIDKALYNSLAASEETTYNII